jgi:hypothetical protein
VRRLTLNLCIVGEGRADMCTYGKSFLYLDRHHFCPRAKCDHHRLTKPWLNVQSVSVAPRSTSGSALPTVKPGSLCALWYSVATDYHGLLSVCMQLKELSVHNCVSAQHNDLDSAFGRVVTTCIGVWLRRFVAAYLPTSELNLMYIESVMLTGVSIVDLFV